MSHLEDAFYAAVTVLAAHGRVKQRLIKAYENHIVEIEEDELPVAAKQRFGDLRQRMHAVTPANGEGPVCASVRKMSKPEADACAEMIVKLYRDVVRFGEDGDDVAAVIESNVAEIVPPPFLVKSG